MTITYPISQCKREVEKWEASMSTTDVAHSRILQDRCYYLNVWQRRLKEAIDQLIAEQTCHLGMAAFYRQRIAASIAAPTRPTAAGETYATERRSIDRGHRRWHLQQAWAIRATLKTL